MKKIFLVLFASLSLIIAQTVFASHIPNSSLADIDGHKYETAILYLQEKAIVSGYADHTFKPEQTINRAEFVKILVGAITETSLENPTKNCFSDVPVSEWFASFVCYAKAENIIDGYSDGRFLPAQEINLAEAAKILVNSLGLEIDETIPTEPWYRPFIETLQNGNYIPASFSSLNQKVKRGEMAEMIWRIKEEINDKPAKEFSFETMIDDKPQAGNPYGFCAVPEDAKEEDVSNPTIVIGNGTAESCTSQAVVSAVAKGGVITFNCGKNPVNIEMEQTAKVFNNASKEIVIDGGGLITLDGQNERRILYMNTCDRDLAWTTPHCNDQDHPKLTVQNLTFINGKSTGTTNTDGGAAIFARGGRLKVVNSRFFNNTCETYGTDVGGAAIRAFDQSQDLPLYIVNSTFGGAEGYGNSCANGGGISSIGVSYTVLNSVFSHNVATGIGANRGKDPNAPGGGNGGAIYNDGGLFNLEVCGTDIHDNVANAGGGGIFFVSNNLTGTLKITDSSLVNNESKEFETRGFPGIYYLGKGDIQISDSTIE